MKNHKLLIPIILLFFCFAYSLYSQKVAQTEDGKKVLLKENGTWEYIKETEKIINGFDYRNTFWGATKTEVRNSEKAKFNKEDEDYMWYEDNIAGFKTLVLYRFVQNKLVRGKYAFYSPHTNKTLYIRDFDKFKEVLTKKYNKAKDDNITWLNDLYKDDFEDWGTAISIGHVQYFTTWETSTTIINLSLSGGNYKINLAIDYISKKFKHLEDKEEEKSNLEKL